MRLDVTARTTPLAPAQPNSLPPEIDAALAELATTLDPVPSACFVIRKDTSLAYVSQGACQSLGYESAELLTLSILDLDVNLSREIWNRIWGISSPPDTTTFPTIHRRKDGSLSPVNVRAVRVLIGGEDVVVSYTVARDLT